MATVQNVITAGSALTNLLYSLSQDGSYSYAEGSMFGRALTVFGADLVGFQQTPCCGDPALKYDDPVAKCNAAVTAGAQCGPGKGIQNQAFYQAVLAAATAVVTVTAPALHP